MIPTTAPTLAALSDEELARRAQAGAEGCFEELVRRFQVPLLRWLRRRGAAAEDAEDLLQEAFLRAYRSIHEYRDKWPFRTWIYTITYRLSVSHARKCRPTKDIQTIQIAGELEDPPALAARHEFHGQLWLAAREVLSDDQFNVIWLYYVEEMPAAQIARVMGHSWVSIKTLLHRARKRLQNRLRPHAPAAVPECTKTARPIVIPMDEISR